MVKHYLLNYGNLEKILLKQEHNIQFMEKDGSED